MKMRIASLSLLTVLCLALVAIPAAADQTLYDNGPINGSVDGWTVNFGYAVTDSFTSGLRLDDHWFPVRRLGVSW